ncbi:matrixin family metalloprotease [bacterium]|mgnify:CR=1 FL=1|nr:matrixin family metalloprotease [bacterium]
MADPTPTPPPVPRWQATLERVVAAVAVRVLGRYATPAVIAIVTTVLGSMATAAVTYVTVPRDTVVETKTEVVEKTVEVPAPAPLIDRTPLDYEGHRFDGGHADHHAHPLPLVGDPLPARWPGNRITYSVDYASARGLNPPLPDTAIQAAFKQATGWWAEQLELDFVEQPAGTAVMIPITFARIDGPQGVLAQAYLADGTTRPKPLTMDSSERWTAGAPASGLVSIPTVACHELGHSLGLDHDAQNAPAVMRPTYTASLPREQARDIDRAVGLGYTRRAKVPPAATDVLTIPVQLKTEDVIQGLRGLGYSVTK